MIERELMSNRIDKPKLTSVQLIEKAKNERGITFQYITEQEAEAYIRLKNNYMRTAAYRKNYQKHAKGINKGKYIDLDFAYLIELSTIDMHIRNLITKMCLDIEHAMKVKMIFDVETEETQDGYTIVDQFLGKKENQYIVKEFARRSRSPFTGDLIEKYFKIEQVQDEITGKNELAITEFDCPVWVLVELLSFGDFIKFYEFYYTTISKIHISSRICNLVKSLRNGCAHNNCIICDLSHGTSRAPAEIKHVVAKINGLGKDMRNKKLSSRPILEFTCVLYMYNQVVSKQIKEHRVRELKELFHERMRRNETYFNKNELIKTSYCFVLSLVDNMLE